MQRCSPPWTGGLVEIPVEVLLDIFSHLSSVELCRCASVNRTWTGLVLQQRFWRTIKFDNLQVDSTTVLRVCARYPALEALSLRNVALDQRTLCSLFTFCPRVSRLTLAGTRTAGMDQVLADVANTLTSLTSLDLSTLAITNGMLRRLDERRSVLEELNLSRCTLSPCETMASGVRVLQLNHGNLRRLRLCGIRIAATELRCPSLEALDVSNSQLSDAVLLPMVTGSPRLRSICLADCRNVTDFAVKDVLVRCRELHTLDASGCVCLTAEVLREAATVATQLTSLSMARCPLLADLAQVPITSPHLRSLDLHGCESLKGLDVSSPVLTSLRLSGCRLLATLAARCPCLSSVLLDGCEALHSVVLHASVSALDMPESRGHLKCVELNNESIAALSLAGFFTMHTLALRCPVLTSLDLSRCCSLTDDSVTGLAASCPLLQELNLEECEALEHLRFDSPSLRALTLSGCKGVVTADLGCPALHALGLEGCSSLDTAHIACSVRHLDLGTCRQLRQLRLASVACRALCIKGCLRLAEARLSCAALRHLDLSFCADMTNAALEALGAAPVQDLNISRCVRVTNSFLADIAHCFPSLTAMNLSYLAIDDETLGHILAQPLELRALELAACKDLHFEDLERTLRSRTLPAMEILDISYTRASTLAVAGWLELCTRLRGLKLNGCANLECRRAVHDAGSRAAAAGEAPQPQDPWERALAAAPGLRSLSLHPTLRQLSLVGCNRLARLRLVGSATIADVNVRSCAALCELGLERCTALRALSAYDCAELQSVSLEACQFVDALDLRNCSPSMRLHIRDVPSTVQIRQ